MYFNICFAWLAHIKLDTISGVKSDWIYFVYVERDIWPKIIINKTFYSSNITF